MQISCSHCHLEQIQATKSRVYNFSDALKAIQLRLLSVALAMEVLNFSCQYCGSTPLYTELEWSRNQSNVPSADQSVQGKTPIVRRMFCVVCRSCHILDKSLLMSRFHFNLLLSQVVVFLWMQGASE